MVFSVAADACAAAKFAIGRIAVAAGCLQRAAAGKIQLRAGIRVIILIGIIGGFHADASKAHRIAALQGVLAFNRQP